MLSDGLLSIVNLNPQFLDLIYYSRHKYRLNKVIKHKTLQTTTFKGFFQNEC